MKLEGSTIVISGATGGMGEALAGLLALEGAALVLLGRDEGKLGALTKSLSGQTKVFPFVCDVTRTEEIQNTCTRILEGHPRLDGLVLLAGYNRNYAVLSEAIPAPQYIKDLERIVDTDLLGTARLIFCLEPRMRAQKCGTIITVASTPVLDVWPQDLLFQIAKVGIKKLTEALSAQHVRDGLLGLKSYCLAPGNVRNPTTYEGMSPKRRAQADTEGWLDSAQHIAPVIKRLLGGELKIPSGSTLRLDLQTIHQYLS